MSASFVSDYSFVVTNFEVIGISGTCAFNYFSVCHSSECIGFSVIISANKLG